MYGTPKLYHSRYVLLICVVKWWDEHVDKKKYPELQKKTILLSLLKFWGFRFGRRKKTLQLWPILKLRKSHILPKCFLFCPFQQVYRYISSIYHWFTSFTWKLQKKRPCCSYFENGKLLIWRKTRKIWRKSWKKLVSAEPVAPVFCKSEYTIDTTTVWLQQTMRSSCWSSMFNGIRPEPTYKRFNSAYLQFNIFF